MKKQSASEWARRLFAQSAAAMNAAPGKRYFARQYPDHCLTLAENPFAALFSRAADESSSPATIPHEPPALAAVDAGGNKTASAQFTVCNCIAETHDTKTFRLSNANAHAFAYLPGQYITLSVDISGQTYQRSYSLASSPSRPGIIDITVKRAANGGIVSNWLNDQLKEGDTLALKGPFGKFSCAKNLPPKLLFLAAGSGIVPIMSMLRWLADTEAHADVTLLASFRAYHDIIYRDELSLLAKRHHNLKLFVALTQNPPANGQWRGLSGHVRQDMLAKQVPDLAERVVYLCGPTAFMSACTAYLLALKVPAAHIFTESFSVNDPIAATAISSLHRQSSRSAKSPNEVQRFTVSFAKSGKKLVSDANTNLLELAERGKINIKHECRSGDCGECMVKCLSGKIEMNERAEIDDIDRSKGWVYCCCAYPASDVVLDV